jgi:pyruvate dehydrogenase E2 component (dihydrolipoamide acetyltransferase)
MATVVTMPKLSPTMEEGVLLRWLKKEGEAIRPGDVIAEVETDKANMEFPIEEEGMVLRLLVKESETVKVGAPVAVVGEKGENVEAALQGAGASHGPSVGAEASQPQVPPPEDDRPTLRIRAEIVEQGLREAAARAEKAAAEAETARAEEAEPPGPEKIFGTREPGAREGAPLSVVPQEEGDGEEDETRVVPGRLRASPLARKIAAEHGLSLRQVAGSGPAGRVVQRDVLAALQAREKRAAATAQAPAAQAKAPAAARGPVLAPEAEVVPLSQMRKTVARRLTEAKQTVPHFYLTMDARGDALWAFYEQLRSLHGHGDQGGKITLNDLVVKATAIALTRVPAANASFSEAGLVRHRRVDIGVAVALEEGLITPVVRDADTKSVGTIAREIRELAARAREKKLRPEEYTGATFSVSNLGMYGVREFAAIINPPESGILAVGAIERRPVVLERGGEDRLAVQRVMTLTLSCDHRVIDGALGARLLGAIVQVIEHPLAMVL